MLEYWSSLGLPCNSSADPRRHVFVFEMIQLASCSIHVFKFYESFLSFLVMYLKFIHPRGLSSLWVCGNEQTVLILSLYLHIDWGHGIPLHSRPNTKLFNPYNPQVSSQQIISRMSLLGHQKKKKRNDSVRALHINPVTKQQDQDNQCTSRKETYV